MLKKYEKDFLGRKAAKRWESTHLFSIMTNIIITWNVCGISDAGKRVVTENHNNLELIGCFIGVVSFTC